MAIEQTITEKETNAVSRANATGLSDSFSYLNEREILSPFVFEESQFQKMLELQEEEKQLGGRLFGLTEDEIQLLPPTQIDPPAFRSDEFRKKGLFERMFGYDPESDMPPGYEKMSEFQRMIFKGQLAAQNLFTRQELMLKG